LYLFNFGQTFNTKTKKIKIEKSIESQLEMIRCHHVTVGAQGEIKWCGGRIISLAESLVAAVLSCHELEDVRKI
jgi:hypothetical protein